VLDCAACPAHNLIEGTIPSALGNLTRLKKLALNSNLIHGTIPDRLGSLQSLVDLNLGGMQGAVSGVNL